jgi:hypothetical protein
MQGSDPEQQLVKAGLDALTAPVKEFLSKVVGYPAEQMGGMLGDRIAFRPIWR